MSSKRKSAEDGESRRKVTKKKKRTVLPEPVADAVDQCLQRLGLSQNPFTMAPDVVNFYSPARVETILVEVLQLIDARMGFALLYGDVGLGKTTICRRILYELDQRGVETALVFNTSLQGVELLREINRDFEVTAPDLTLYGQMSALNAFLLEQRSQGRNCVIVIDDAQGLTVESLELVRQISNMETGIDKIVQILLIGQPELEEKLDLYSLRQLKSRIVLKREFRPYTAQETATYIRTKIARSGDRVKLEVADNAVRLVHEASQGIPRRINVIMGRSLYAAVAENTHVVSREVAQTAIRDIEESLDEFDARRPRRRRIAAVAAGLIIALSTTGFLMNHYGFGPPSLTLLFQRTTTDTAGIEDQAVANSRSLPRNNPEPGAANTAKVTSSGTSAEVGGGDTPAAAELSDPPQAGAEPVAVTDSGSSEPAVATDAGETVEQAIVELSDPPQAGAEPVAVTDSGSSEPAATTDTGETVEQAATELTAPSRPASSTDIATESSAPAVDAAADQVHGESTASVRETDDASVRLAMVNSIPDIAAREPEIGTPREAEPAQPVNDPSRYTAVFGMQFPGSRHPGFDGAGVTDQGEGADEVMPDTTFAAAFRRDESYFGNAGNDLPVAAAAAATVPVVEPVSPAEAVQASEVDEAVWGFLDAYELTEFARQFETAVRNLRFGSISEEIVQRTGLRVVVLPGIVADVKDHYTTLQIPDPRNDSTNYLLFWDPDEWPEENFSVFYTQDAVMRLQRALNRFGAYHYFIDGLVGRRTVAALELFQRAVGLPQTGKPDIETLFMLEFLDPQRRSNAERSGLKSTIDRGWTKIEQDFSR